MNCLRRCRSRIGIFVAAMLFAAAGLPGVLAAAQGVQLQAPICGPAGTDLPTDPGPAAESHNDHCKIFPCGAVFGVVSPVGNSLLVSHLFESGHSLALRQDLNTPFRSELTPLNGRAPPSQR